MASAPAAPRPPHSSTHHQSTLGHDPFWHATPRANTGIASLMSAVQQVVPPTTTPTPAIPPRARRLQCTHVTMSRAYGQFPCAFCGRVPEMGWVYACKQDDLPGQHDPLPDVDTRPPGVPGDCDHVEATARLAEYLQMSTSVVQSMRAGRYGVDQANKLIAQREKVIRTIKAKEQEMASQPHVATLLHSVSSAPTESLIASAGSGPIRSPATSSTGSAASPANPSSPSTSTAPVQSSRPRPGCQFQFCHTCRPFFVDRMYASFESVISGKFADLSPSEVARLPVMSSKIALKFGLPKQSASPVRLMHSQQSMDLSSHCVKDVDDEISVDWTRTTNNDDDDSTISDTLDNSELYPCPGPGQCPVWSRHSGCAYDTGFDDGRRATNHGFLAEHEARRLTPDTSASELLQTLSETPGASSTASSVSLPTTPTTSFPAPVLPGEETFDVALQKRFGMISKAHSSGGDHSPHNSRPPLLYKDSKSSMGNEVEVKGGVALTEEAVETHTPDIVTAN